MKTILIFLILNVILLNSQNEKKQYYYCEPEFWIEQFYKYSDSLKIEEILKDGAMSFIENDNVQLDYNFDTADSIFWKNNIWSLSDLIHQPSSKCDDFLRVNGYPIYLTYELGCALRYSIYMHLTNRKYDFFGYLDSTNRYIDSIIRVEKLNENLDSIDGIYIPYDLEDAISSLNKIFNTEEKILYKEMSEDDFISLSHFSIGQAIRNDWGLWGYSRIRTHLINLGITNPDKMSSFILTAYHRRLKGIDYDLEELIKEHSD